MAEKITITRAELVQAMLTSFDALPRLARQHIDGDHLTWYMDDICVELGFTSGAEAKVKTTKENLGSIKGPQH